MAARSSSRSPTGWSDSVLVLEPKPGKTHELLEGWRPICLVSTMFTWYEASLWTSKDRTLQPLPPWILGFRKGAQAIHAAGCLQRALARAAEWGQPLLVLSV